MESLRFVSGGKGLISNEANSFSDDFVSRKMKMPWWAGDSKAPCTFGNNILVSDQDTIFSNQHLGELGLEGKQLPEISVGNVFSGKVVDGEKIFSPFALSPPFSLEDDSSSRISCSIVETYRRELPLIDLKLGGFAEPRDGKNSRIYNGPSIASSSNSSVPQKRMRMGMNSPTSYCQVNGCNKDLSSSKAYHKRHKVCEAHSKTSKVVINGIEQRFCQQCSRFHLLSEFDDGKRSCRKRLAGHNERRRKLQVGFHSRRAGRHTQPYNVSGTSAGFDSTLTVPSFICPDLRPGSILRQENHQVKDWCRCIKLEEEARFSPMPIFPISTNENTNCFRNMGGSCSVLRDTLGNDNFPNFDAASNIQGFSSGMAETGFALSLLSSQSQNSSSHSSGIPVPYSLVPGSDTHHGMAQVSERLMRINCQASTSGMPNSFSLPGISSAEGSHPSPILISSNSEPINFDIADGLYQGSKDQLCCEDGATIALCRMKGNTSK